MEKFNWMDIETGIEHNQQLLRLQKLGIEESIRVLWRGHPFFRVFNLNFLLGFLFVVLVAGNIFRFFDLSLYGFDPITSLIFRICLEKIHSCSNFYGKCEEAII